MSRVSALLVSLSFATTALAVPVPDAGWSAYGGDAGGTRYSSAAQITPANVDKLQVAWIFRTGELGQGVKDWSRSAFEATPILYDGTLVSHHQQHRRGRRERGHRQAALAPRQAGAATTCTIPMAYRAACRCGWTRRLARNAVCHARIYAPTLDGRLLALDAATGKACVDFGEQGAVNLLKDVRSQFAEGDEWRDYLVTSPPAILDGKVIVGSAIGDNRAVLEELGIVRAFDARSGRLVWSWDPIPRDASNPVYKEWSPGAARRPAPPTPGRRCPWTRPATSSSCPRVRPARTSSVASGPATTAGPIRSWPWTVTRASSSGASSWCITTCGTTTWRRSRRWWSSCMAASPWRPSSRRRRWASSTRSTATAARRSFPSRNGRFRRTQCRASSHPPTQPYPVAPPALTRQAPVTPDDAWGIAWFDTRACRKRIETYRSEGMFQPPAVRDSLMQPGNAGGSNWGGIAFDPRRQLAVANTMNLPFVVALIPRARTARSRPRRTSTRNSSSRARKARPTACGARHSSPASAFRA